MTNLLSLFKTNFNITEDINLNFNEDDGQLYVIWKDELIELSYGKNERFYSKNSILKKYGIGLARALKLEQEVQLPSNDLTTFISEFKLYYNITEEIQLKFPQENGKLFVRFKGENIQLSLQMINSIRKLIYKKWGMKFLKSIHMEIAAKKSIKSKVSKPQSTPPFNGRKGAE